jgi:branched-chain amino acid aminotransferase
VIFTPVPNGTFLDGITRQRIIGLLRQSGIMVIEKSLCYHDFETADEIFSTGNYSKVVPLTRIGDRSLDFGPLYSKARELYWDFAHSAFIRTELPVATAAAEDVHPKQEPVVLEKAA